MKKPGALGYFSSFFFVFLVLLSPKLLEVRRLEMRSDALSREIERLRAENKALDGELRSLREDPVYLEKVARQKFNKAKEGEIVYKVVHDPAEVKNQTR